MAEAFEFLWSEVGPHVAAYCRRVTRDADDADDLCQLVAVRAWRGYGTFRGDCTFLTWVMSIAQREAARMAARRSRIGLHEQMFEPGLHEIAARDSVADQVVSAADAGWLRAVADEARGAGELGENEYNAVAARLDHPDDTWQRIGDLLGLDPGACAVAHSRALVKLRVVLLTRYQDRLGGQPALERALSRADLTGTEAQAFRAIVIDRRQDYLKPGWQSALRGACTKVARHLAPP
jgi:RNA polymerase sigma factor (sigma-70 family)